MAEKRTFRCCYCRTENDYTFDRGEMNRGLHKKKTQPVSCSTCGDRVLQNMKGR
jgi:DNA-directed RNA polymerase subunit RPC12/RpoP